MFYGQGRKGSVKFPFCFVLFGLGLVSNLAFAQSKNETTSADNWTGIYLGAGLGAGAAVHQLNTEIGGLIDARFNGIGAEGVLAEIYGGVDYQISNRFVIGIGASAQWSSIATTLNFDIDVPSIFDASIDYRLAANYAYDVFARVGYAASSKTLAYIRGGYSWQNFSGELDITARAGGPPIFAFGTTYDLDFSGWTAGLGLETKLTPNISAKLEYVFKQFDGNYYLFDIVEIEPSLHQVSMGLAYRLGSNNSLQEQENLKHVIANWTGFHFGIDIGAGAPIQQINGYFDGILPINASSEFNGIGGEGFIGSLRAGYDHEFGKRWVAGLFASANWSSMATSADISIPIGPVSADYEMVADFGYDLVARLGMRTNDNLLVYGLGGYSYQNFEAKLSVPGLFSTGYDLAYHGWTAGVGFEVALSERLFAHLEYRYTDFMEERLLFDIVGIEPSLHAARVGVSYKVGTAN